jgi:hypothetical protein
MLLSRLLWHMQYRIPNKVSQWIGSAVGIKKRVRSWANSNESITHHQQNREVCCIVKGGQAGRAGFQYPYNISQIWVGDMILFRNRWSTTLVVGFAAVAKGCQSPFGPQHHTTPCGEEWTTIRTELLPHREYVWTWTWLACTILHHVIVSKRALWTLKTYHAVHSFPRHPQLRAPLECGGYSCIESRLRPRKQQAVPRRTLTFSLSTSHDIYLLQRGCVEGKKVLYCFPNLLGTAHAILCSQIKSSGRIKRWFSC